MMRTPTIFFFLCLFGITQAQYIQKDLIFVSGTSSFSFNADMEDKEVKNGSGTLTTDVANNLSFNLQPKVGVMLSDKLGAGITLSYVYLRQTFIDRDGTGTIVSENKLRTNDFAAGPFLRFYFQQGDNYGLYVNGELLAGGRNTNDERPGFSDTSFDIFQLGAGIGGQFFLNEHVALEANLGYNRRSFGNDELRNINSGLAFNMGITVFLQRKL